MKVVIMAAGKGVRMLPITETIPKVLVEVNGKPFLYYLMKNLKKSGFDEFGIIAGYKKEKIDEFVKKYGFDAEIIEQKEQLGTADAVKRAKDFVAGENFVVVGGDNLFDVKDLKKFNKDDSMNYIAGYKIDNPERYGVLVVKGDKLVKIHEKPKEFVGNLINAGLYKFTPEIFDAISKIGKSPRGEYELTDAISLLAEKGKVKVIPLESFWKDFGKLEDIPLMEKFLKDSWKE
jgi:dTDP-glucose pyrophosphorylase